VIFISVIDEAEYSDSQCLPLFGTQKPALLLAQHVGYPPEVTSSLFLLTAGG
jgi:hypothetical protein